MHCNKCGMCCKRFSVPRVTIYNYHEFLKIYPFLTVSDWGGTDKCMVPIFDCSRLVQGENGTFVCSDYENRPTFCKAFPERDQKVPSICDALVAV